MGYIMHDSQNTWFRNPFGAVETGRDITLKIEGDDIDEAYLNLIYPSGENRSVRMNKEQKVQYPNTFVFSTTINTGDRRGLIFYSFTIKQYGRVFFYGNNQEFLGGEGKIYNNNPISYQITVYRECESPKWYKEGIVYQIFVDRFFNGNECCKIENPKSNSFIYARWDDRPMYIKNNDGSIVRWDFYGGNLLGVIKKLGYLHELGVTAIYFNPIFEASSSHRYDTGDYKKIDPMFGDEDIFKKLCVEAEKLGIHIILDGVFSHTGSDSIYFNKYGNYDSVGAYQSKESPYYEWYQFSYYPDKYECWWGIGNQPNVNELVPSYLDYIIYDKDSVINKWMNLGADGWRLDVADELPDKFIKELKKEMKKNKKDSVLIGEVWEDASNKVSYGSRREYLYGDELDSTMNYPFRDDVIGFLLGNIDSRMFIRKMMSLKENYPRENFYSMMNMLGTHDTERILTVFENNRSRQDAVKLLKIAVAIQMTLPGVPHIYYGDEVGVTGGKDPDNRSTYPWGKEDNDILSHYKKMLRIRTRSTCLKKGELRFYGTDYDVIAFERYYKNEKVITVVNRNLSSSKNITLDILEGEYENMLTEKKEVLDSKTSIKVGPAEIKILKLLIDKRINILGINS
ncbi:MAG: glycoside hydrolase family 13 protein [Inconstantimicrobium porci]|nr:glycoside hydrolase family 13 protein [Inconstantimicrobium porci]MDY5912687.1 glycoside hydrolase family 13 protein [Inconstantimicrobium porci]